MPVSPFATSFPTNWQESRDSGATWGAAPAPAVTNQQAGPHGTQRFRQIFTIPQVPGGTFNVTVGGDIWDGTVNNPAELLYDGVPQGTVPIGGSRVYTLPVVPGVHTVTLMIGAADDSGPATAPSVTFDFTNVISGMPCDCCPTGEPRCALVALQFATAAQTLAAAGWTQVNLSVTADGVTATAVLSGYNSPSGVSPVPTPEVTYTISPQGRVRGLRLWNQGGSNLNDADGLGPFTADFYAGATLLATLVTSGANGGAAQTLLLPPGTELSGVDSVVLRNLAKQASGTVAPLWRELQLVAFQTVFPCRRRTGVLEWYNQAGSLVPSAEVVSCDTGAGSFVTIPDLRLTGSAFGDGPDPAGENLCSVIPAPASTTGFTLTGVCYDPTTGAPTMDWTLPSGIELEYGNPPNTSGGVFVSFSSPTLGSITWVTNNTSMSPGEQRTSNIFGGGRRAVLTYLSGPLATAPSQTIRMTGGATLGIHLGTTDNTTPPIRFRLDFVAA